MAPQLQLEHLEKSFTAGHDAVQAVDDLSLSVPEGEFLVVLGPSGSGKTTLLRCIAGLERPDAGEVWVGGRQVYSAQKRVWVAPERRDVSMVFQSYALWPHMTVFDNVAYPLRAQHIRRAKVAVAVNEALVLVGCGQLGSRYPSQLSGGQQQRISLARAIVRESKLILFDEPLSSVDTRVREDLRAELGELQRKLGFAAVYITHDQTEAVVLAHRLAIFASGRIAQIGSPREVYRQPASTYAAEFLGAANRYEGQVTQQFEEQALVESSIGRLVVADPGSAGGVGQHVDVIIRPEHCRVTAAPPGESPGNVLEGKVERSTFLGYCTEYRLLLSTGQTLFAKSLGRSVFRDGETLWIDVLADDIALVAAE